MSINRWQFVGNPIGAIAAFSWALTLSLATPIAALLGLGAVAQTTAWMAKLLFIIFAVALLLSMIVAKRQPSI